MKCNLCGERNEVGYEYGNRTICKDCVEDIALTFTEQILGLPCTTLDYCDFVLISYYGYEAIKSLSPVNRQKLYWAFQAKASAREL